jgi:hypothetical protein
LKIEKRLSSIFDLQLAEGSMTYRISIEELGIAGDNAVFEGAAPGDVWRQVAEHLQKTRGIKLPDPGEILSGGDAGIIPPRFDNAIAGQQSPVIAPVVRPGEGTEDETGVNIIVTRLLEKLRMGQSGPGGETLPSGGGPPLVP